MTKLDLVKMGLQSVINNIDCGNSSICEAECDEVLDMINKVTNNREKLSKYQACKFVGKSRSTFDNMVKEGKIPPGRKEQGFKELFWFKQDLINIKEN